MGSNERTLMGARSPSETLHVELEAFDADWLRVEAERRGLSPEELVARITRARLNDVLDGVEVVDLETVEARH